MTFPDGNNAFGEFWYSNSFQSRYDIWSEKSIISTHRAFNIRRNQSSKISITSGKNSKTLQVKKHDQFKLLLDYFCKIIQKNMLDKSLFEDSLLSQALIMDYARKSSKTKSSLEIKPWLNYSRMRNRYNKFSTIFYEFLIIFNNFICKIPCQKQTIIWCFDQ